MITKNTKSNVLIAGNDKEEFEFLQSKLMLLRNVKSIVQSTIEDAVEDCRKNIPETLILFADKGDKRILDICTDIRTDSVLENMPIMLVMSEFDEDFVLTAFDYGINDYIVKPIKDSDLLMRTIWCLQKSENIRNLEKKQALLAELEIVDSSSNIYKQSAIARVFNNEISFANRYKYSVALMGVSLNTEAADDKFLSQILKASVRSTDLIGKYDTNKFFVVLNKSDEIGINTVYERIKDRINERAIISVGACISQNHPSYEHMEKAVNAALEKAMRVEIDTLVLDQVEAEVEEQNANKLYKQIFAKKIETSIMPAFEIVKENLESISLEICLEANAEEGEAYFSITKKLNNNNAVLKVYNNATSKVTLDCIYTKDGESKTERSALNIQKLDQQYVIDSLGYLVAKFNEL